MQMCPQPVRCIIFPTGAMRQNNVKLRQPLIFKERPQKTTFSSHIKGTYDVIDKFIVVIRGRTTTRAEAGLFRCAIYGLAIL